MAKYRVYGERHVFKYISEVIEADSKEEARKIATDKLNDIDAPDDWDDTAEPQTVFQVQNEEDKKDSYTF